MFLQIFAAVSSAGCNFGAYFQNKDDIEEKKPKKSGAMNDMNTVFLWIEIFQLVLCGLCICAIQSDNRRISVILIWLEDLVLEIPLIWIVFKITRALGNSPVSIILVLVGGIMSIAVAIFETISLFKDKERARLREEFFTNLLPAENSDCACVLSVLMPRLIELWFMIISWLAFFSNGSILVA